MRGFFLHYLYLAFLVLFSSFWADGRAFGSEKEVFYHGLSLYDRGEYEKAILEFEKLLAKEPARGHVLYNLGNAYYKSGQKGAALAAYFGARRLLPRSPDLKANIKHIQSKTKDNLKASLERPFWLFPFIWVEALSLREAAYIASISLSLSFLLLGLGFMVPSFKRPFMYSFAAVFCGALFLSLGFFARSYQEQNWGAVVEPSAQVFSGKDKGAAVVFELKEGAPVLVLKAEGDWAKVKISDGKMGWLAMPSLKYYSF